jgi:hypothetical protein
MQGLAPQESEGQEDLDFVDRFVQAVKEELPQDLSSMRRLPDTQRTSFVSPLSERPSDIQRRWTTDRCLGLKGR